MFMLAIKHDVEDYDAWKAVYDTLPPTEAGASFARVNRAVDSPETVLVVAGFSSAEAAKSFVEMPELRQKMGEAGVVGEPRIELYEQVDSTEG
ncbi:MAG: cyclase [Acidimicrobiia bacterium]|nr:cyclase [Acidimicrobiia bacterium]